MFVDDFVLLDQTRKGMTFEVERLKKYYNLKNLDLVEQRHSKYDVTLSQMVRRNEHRVEIDSQDTLTTSQFRDLISIILADGEIKEDVTHTIHMG